MTCTTNDRSTARPVNIPTVIAAGCSDALLARCWDAIAPLGVMVRDCEPAALPTLAAARQPLVIVVPSALYASDPDELDALARDVRATLIEVDEVMGGRDLEATLSLAVRAAMRRREERAPSSRPSPARSGRYSILPGDPIEVSAWSSASSAPPASALRPGSILLDDLEQELLTALR
jgi:hypothetical protein